MDESIEKLIRSLSVKLAVAEQQNAIFQAEFAKLREACKGEPEFLPNKNMGDVVVAIIKRLKAQATQSQGEAAELMHAANSPPCV